MLILQTDNGAGGTDGIEINMVRWRRGQLTLTVREADTGEGNQVASIALDAIEVERLRGMLAAALIAMGGESCA